MVKDTIFILHEENHGAIGAVATPQAAAQFIIDENWITVNDEIWDYHEHEFVFAFEAMKKLGYEDDDLYSFCCAMFKGDHAKDYDWVFSLSKEIFYH